MAVPDGHIGTKEAAESLGCTQSNVPKMFHAGKLAGVTGSQSQRPRIYIQVDGLGRPLDPTGKPFRANELQTRLDAHEERLASVERTIEDRSGSSSEVERLRDATLLLQGVSERLQRASVLQAEANRELTDAVTEQGRVISTLLVEDPDAVLQADGPQPAD